MIRKLAREAVIFALLGMILAAVGSFALLSKDIRTHARIAGAQAVHAFVLQPGEFFRPLDGKYLVRQNGEALREAQPFLQVPLANGALLYVRVCPRFILVEAAAQPCQLVRLDQSKITPIFDTDHPHRTVPTPTPPPGFIPDPVSILGGWVTLSAADYQNVSDARTFALPVGDVNQVAIEKDYWAAYRKWEHDRFFEYAFASLYIGLWGFPGGLGLWAFYRLVRFAIKG